MNNLFVAVMEAEGNDLQPFSDVPEDDVGQSRPDTNNGQMGDNTQPPPLNEENADDLAFSDDSNNGTDGGNSEYDDNGDGGTNPEEDKKHQDKLSEKANNILNQQLYQQMIDYSEELKCLLENIQTIIPVLPYETVRQIDEYSTKLNKTLSTLKEYIINKFINSQYGENLLFFEKVKSLSSILKDQINKCIKHIEKN